MKKILMLMAIMIAVVVQANAQTTNNVYNGANYSVIIEEVVPVKGMIRYATMITAGKVAAIIFIMKSMMELRKS